MQTGTEGAGRILVVNNEETFCKIAPKVLRRIGREEEIICATSGEEALTLVQNQRFDLILLDLDMPISKGFNILDSLLQQENTLGIKVPPVYIFTESEREEDIVKALQYPMVREYFNKPFEPGVARLLFYS